MHPAPPDTLAARKGRTRNGSRVHCDSLDRGGARLCPCGLAAVTPQTFSAASPDASFTGPESSHSYTPWDAPLPTHIHQIRVGKALRGFTTSVPHVLLSIPLTGPAPSGSTDTPRLCQGCSHPPRHLPARAALSSDRAAATTRRQRSLTSTQITAPHGAQRKHSMRSQSPSTADSRQPKPTDETAGNTVSETVP